MVLMVLLMLSIDVYLRIDFMSSVCVLDFVVFTYVFCYRVCTSMHYFMESKLMVKH